MLRPNCRFVIAVCWLALVASVDAAGRYVAVEYPASTERGGLQMGVAYTLWIPDGVSKLRGIIVHQHGCGVGACQGGETAAYDLHWQALAQKWDCALLGPSYRQAEQQNCRLWCDPRNGSAKTFLKSLDDLAAKSEHPEVSAVPWCLWGHSGGAFWASLMQTLYPERIVALWFRSGGAHMAWNKGEIPKPDIMPAACAIPMMLNPGVKERDDPTFQGAWITSTGLFHLYRERGAPVGFAPDPMTGHECGDSRYLAIPFFDACLEMRLPNAGGVSQELKLVDPDRAQRFTLTAEPPDELRGIGEGELWLPNARFAELWKEYITAGSVTDTTPPDAPTNVRLVISPDGSREIAWDAAADFESGLKCFLIRRQGTVVGRVPETPIGKFGRPLFQSMSYHDTPEKPLPKMAFPSIPDDEDLEVIAVNSVGLESKPARVRK